MALPSFVAPAAISLGSSLLGGLFGNNKPQFQFTSDDIDNLINTFRSSGIEGIRQLGEQQAGDAIARLSASGLEPSLALQQSLFTPILQNLMSARTGLEGNLAQTSGNLNLARAQAQFAADQNSQNPLGGLFSQVGDIAGLFAVRELFGGGGGGGSANGGFFQAPLGLRDFTPGSRIG